MAYFNVLIHNSPEGIEGRHERPQARYPSQNRGSKPGFYIRHRSANHSNMTFSEVTL